MVEFSCFKLKKLMSKYVVAPWLPFSRIPTSRASATGSGIAATTEVVHALTIRACFVRQLEKIPNLFCWFNFNGNWLRYTSQFHF